MCESLGKRARAAQRSRGRDSPPNSTRREGSRTRPAGRAVHRAARLPVAPASTRPSRVSPRCPRRSRSAYATVANFRIPSLSLGFVSSPRCGRGRVPTARTVHGFLAHSRSSKGPRPSHPLSKPNGTFKWDAATAQPQRAAEHAAQREHHDALACVVRTARTNARDAASFVRVFRASTLFLVGARESPPRRRRRRDTVGPLWGVFQRTGVRQHAAELDVARKDEPPAVA